MAEDNLSDNPRPPKRKALFFVGILIGLLLGALVAMLIVDWIDYQRPTVVKVLERSQAASKDTVVQYVIHKHVTEENDVSDDFVPDSLMADSTFIADDSQDLMMDDDDLDEWQDAGGNAQNVMEDRMLSKSSVKVVYLDHNKREQSVPANALAQIHVQQWSTPIKNRISYQFSGNTLKIKGMDIGDLRVVNFKGDFYAVSGKHVFLLKPNEQYGKLVETPDMSFTIN